MFFLSPCFFFFFDKKSNCFSRVFLVAGKAKKQYNFFGKLLVREFNELY